MLKKDTLYFVAYFASTDKDTVYLPWHRLVAVRRGLDVVTELERYLSSEHSGRRVALINFFKVR